MILKHGYVSPRLESSQTGWPLYEISISEMIDDIFFSFYVVSSFPLSTKLRLANLTRRVPYTLNLCQHLGFHPLIFDGVRVGHLFLVFCVVVYLRSVSCAQCMSIFDWPFGFHLSLYTCTHHYREMDNYCSDLAMCSYDTLYWIHLDKSSINVLSCVDIFCSKYQTHRISHTRLHPWCDFAMKNSFLENQSTIAYVYIFFFSKNYLSECQFSWVGQGKCQHFIYLHSEHPFQVLVCTVLLLNL